MPKKAKEQAEERILLFNNWNRKKDLEKVLNNVISIANNTVIPICNALNIPLVEPNVLKWVDDEDAFREDFVAKCKREAAVDNVYLGRITEKSAREDFDTQLTNYPYPVFRGITKLYSDLVPMVTLTKRGVMTWDDKKLTEYTNVYLTDKKQIEGYRRAEELCGFLNEFFSGTQLAPRRDALTEWSRAIFTSPDGTFNVNPRQDFSKLIKK